MHWGAKKVAAAAPPPPSATQTTPTSTSPKTPTALTPQDSCSLENASKISKRQLEKKIHEIALKESRSPNYKPVWYVRDAVLHKYNIDQDNMAPFLPLSSPLSTTAADPAARTTTPTTPRSTVCEKKNHLDGTRTLFDMLKKSPHTALLTTPPQPKRIKLQLHIDKIPVIQNPGNHSPLQLHIDKIPVTQNPGNHSPPPTITQKRNLEEPAAQLAAKRLCLDDTTNKTGGEDKPLVGGEDKPLVQNNTIPITLF